MTKKNSQLILVLFAVLFPIGLLSCSNNSVNRPISENGVVKTVKPQKLGSGKVKWFEETVSDGWIRILNQGGENLGYSEESGILIIQVDGFAFKDLDRDGVLDGYEDWRLDNNVRARDLAAQISGNEISPLLTHGGWNSFGKKLDGDLDYLKAGGRAGVTRSAGSNGNTVMAVTWINSLQEYAETEGKWGIPVTVSIDPNHISNLIDQNSLAATMDTDLASDVAKEMSRQYRSLGITMLLGPQVDLATNPAWCRSSGTFSEDPALNRDLAASFVDCLQSTYDENGNDLGWGNDSLIAISKHFAGAGASEGGRNDHNATGKYTVFPGKNFAAHLIPFFDGAFNLPGVTKKSGGLMPNYAISYSDNESLGELVGGGYSEFKIDLLRKNGYEGFILTDWQITDDNARNFGVEDKSIGERFYMLFKAGNDQVGGTTDTANAIEGYNLLVKDIGQDKADSRMREAAEHFFITQMNVDLFDNPYITKEYAVETTWNTETNAFGKETQEKSVIMIKNSGETLPVAEKSTVYIPYASRAKGNMFMGYHNEWEPSMDISELKKRFNVVTDSLGKPSGKDKDGNPVYTTSDVIRASKLDIAKCDYAIISMDSPVTDSELTPDGNWLPPSLQYNSYAANSDSVREVSMAGDITEQEVEGFYGTMIQKVQENRSYKGNTSGRAKSYGDLEALQYVNTVIPDNCKVIVTMKSKGTMVWGEVEPLADAILVYYAENDFFTNECWFGDDTLIKVISGNIEPQGLLPLQQPLNMEAYEAQNEDVPRDLECYIDGDGNKYDFAFGMNWSGKIKDSRVKKYSEAPLKTPSTISF